LSLKTVRVGVIGCGDIVMAQHLPALKSHPSVHLAAVCDVDVKRAEEAAMAGGSDYYTADYKQLLADPLVEAAIVCTPPWVTPHITMEALRSKKDVLCEKPMATNLALAERVAAVERKSGRLLQVGFTYRHGPLMDTLKSWIDEGRIGHPLQIRISVFDEVWDPEGNAEHYRRILETLQHGPPCLHDGAHAADHLAFLTGSSPIRTVASGRTTRPEFPAPNYNAALIDFANGDLAKLEIGWFYPHFPTAEFEIVGPGGAAYLHRSKNEAVLKSGNVIERVQLSEDRIRSCFRIQLDKFLNYIATRNTPVPGSREGIASLRLTSAIAEAIETGLPVKLNGGEAS
jgi:myo-inositol 2-dehydrogenase/D-chiro-inositol 1-dehydrogenase